MAKLDYKAPTIVKTKPSESDMKEEPIGSLEDMASDTESPAEDKGENEETEQSNVDQCMAMLDSMSPEELKAVCEKATSLLSGDSKE